MISTNTLSPEPLMPLLTQPRHLSQSQQPTVLSDIHQEEINIAIWQRELSATIRQEVDDLLVSNPTFRTEMTLTPQCALSRLNESFASNDLTALSEDIAGLVDKFCHLFEIKQVAMRLKVLGQTMCPKFHTDKVPCRLVTTYQSVATEWLPSELLDPTKLGLGSNGQADNVSGLYKNQSDIQQLRCGDVALLKGILWQGNENLGLVHRSPELPSREKRLLLTLDF